MKSHTEYLTFNVPARMDFINITQPGRGDRPQERHPGRAAPLQRHAHHGQRVHQR